MLNLDDYDTVRVYGAEYRGIAGYYLLASDVWRLGARAPSVKQQARPCAGFWHGTSYLHSGDRSSRSFTLKYIELEGSRNYPVPAAMSPLGVGGIHGEYWTGTSGG